jgi:hypothetical protein
MWVNAREVRHWNATGFCNVFLDSHTFYKENPKTPMHKAQA